MPHLILTPGDPTGIGPEIAVKALQRLHEFPDMKLTVIGSQKALEQAAGGLNLPLPDVTYHDVEAALPGAVAYQAIEAAVELIAANYADALVTGPISKRNLQAAGYDAHGHTEILEALAEKYFPSAKKIANENGENSQGNGSKYKAEMLFVHKNFRLMLLTRHIALHDVPKALAKKGAVAGPLKTLIRFLRHTLGISEPRIALLGVNPHAGETGGEEEKKFFAPVIAAVNAIGASRLEGPFAADAFFRGFRPQASGYDAIVAAYHDQGLIPFKLLAGYEAVNMTIGLPFIRTSVGHGTAEDIAGRGIAREDSLIAALHMALEIVRAGLGRDSQL